MASKPGVQRGQAKVDTRTINYATYAPNYDKARFTGAANTYLERVRLNALAHALEGVDRSARVLDVGCGTGRGLVQLRSLGFESVFGLDFTPEMLAQSRAKVQAEPPRLVRGDAFKLPIPLHAFDAIVSLNFVHMFRLELQVELVAQMAQACRPGGRLVIEFESIHKGLFVSRYLEQRRVKSQTKFNSMWEIRDLFPRPRFADVRVVGSGLPKLHAAFRSLPSVGERIEALALYPPLNWLAERIFVAATPMQHTGAVADAHGG